MTVAEPVVENLSQKTCIRYPRGISDMHCMIPYLSSGLAKNSKIMSFFVLFSLLFGHLESLICLPQVGAKPYAPEQ